MTVRIDSDNPEFHSPLSATPMPPPKHVPPVYSWRNIDVLHFVMLVAQPLLGIWLTLRYWNSISWNSWALFLPTYVAAALGITLGYHRMWSHRAFQGTLPVRIAMAICGASAMQGSIRFWCRGHRYHHRFTDTPRDPYNSINGLFYSHIGWMLFRQNYPWDKSSRVDISDLDGDWVVRLQHRFYIPLAFFFSLGLPTLISWYFWNNPLGGFIVATNRQTLLHHCTFCINSLAHAFGSQGYDDKLTPRDHVICALVTFGEGYHNFHHQFPNDYRNGVRYYHFDPTKWVVRTLSFFGLVYNVKRFPDNEIKKSRVSMEQKRLDKIKEGIQYGPLPENLPTMTWAEFRRRCRENGEPLVVVYGLVHNIGSFLHDHPGGVAFIKSGIGRDITRTFTGEVYDHSRAAQNFLSMMRIARLEEEDCKKGA